MVGDEQAAARVWLAPGDCALAAMPAGAVVLEVSTTTRAWVHRLAEAAAARGLACADGPVVGSRPQAEAGKLVFLLGGTSEVVARLVPILNPVAGAVFHVGDVGHGMVLKLMVNALFGIQVAALAELQPLAAAGLEPAHAQALLAKIPVTSEAAAAAGQAMINRAFAMMFPIDLVGKDFGCVQTTGEALDAALPRSAATAAVFQQAIRAGYGGDNITGVARLYS
ncbi:NAD(P)-dependent oxidoreductase [Acanthopleuribacter pedis]